MYGFHCNEITPPSVRDLTTEKEKNTSNSSLYIAVQKNIVSSNLQNKSPACFQTGLLF